MKKLHVETPVWVSKNNNFDATIYYKMDALQPSGSFKLRGIGYACQQAVEGGAKSIVTSSGGNAGLAATYASVRLGVPITVFVPATTSEAVRQKLRQEGATVIEHGKSWDEAHLHALSIAASQNAGYIHPFDDPVVWTGHASMIKEVESLGIKPDVVILSVGGGGLMCGVLEGMHDLGWKDVPVVAVETEGTASLNGSIEAGKLITLEKISSVATTLGACTVAEKAFEWTRHHPIISHVVSDREAIEACIKFANQYRVLVEPACGAALSVLQGDVSPAKGFKNILMVVCGGSGVSLDAFKAWEQKLQRSSVE